ncbi:MAG: DUF366 family protein [Firmicutes bacterium]|nr:DUF366 family protein [Bacillota bacterium]
MQSLYYHQMLTYDGSQLSSLWAFRTLGVQGDSIICFRGPCRVELAGMVDMEDVRRASPIFSRDMLHFIVEHFDSDLEKTILKQRLLIAIIKDIIEREACCRLRRSGDDLYFGGDKLSVSIATLSPVSTMIHTGLNVSSKGTPVPAAGLATELGLPETRVPEIGQLICRAYADEVEDVRLARCKVRGVP